MKKVSVGKYVNFTVQRVITDRSGARSYCQKKFIGQVIDTVDRNGYDAYKIRIHKSNEIHEVFLHKITHVWYIV